MQRRKWAGTTAAAAGIVLAGCLGVRDTCGPFKNTSLANGVYEGRATRGPVKVVAQVTITDSRITDIKLIQHRKWRGGIAEKEIPTRIIRQQSTCVDAVTGATVSSNAIMSAVQSAVSKAAEAAAHTEQK